MTNGLTGETTGETTGEMTVVRRLSCRPFRRVARGFAHVLLAGVATLLAIGCTRFTAGPPSAVRDLPRVAIGHPFDHVIIIVLENASYESAMAEPYLAELARRGRLLLNFHAVAHPSYPNYLAMITGRRIRTSGDRQEVIRVPSIAAALEARGFTWRQYAEAMPVPCYGQDSAGYARKHVPFMSIAAVIDSPARCQNVVPARRFDPAHLPNYAFYTPDIRNDGHDTNVHYAARWLRRFLEPLLAPGGTPPGTLVVVTFDESEELPIGPQANHIYTVLLGDAVRPGKPVSTYYDHFDMLRTVEDNFGLVPLASADSAARSISGIWAR